MSRNYAQIFTAIWRDPDFLALNRTQQQAYFLLVTQPNISAAGMLPITERRWAKLSADGSIEELLADIAHLHKVGMVVVDEDTEELLVRSFVRHDNGYRNPRRQPSIRDAAQDIQSTALRQVLAVELVRLGCPGWLPEMARVVGAGDDATMPDADPTGDVFSHVNSHSDSHSSSRADIDGMAIDLEPARTTTPNPQPGSRNPSVPSERPGFADAPLPADNALFAATDDDTTGSSVNEPTRTQRAFGIARAWIDHRDQQGTPVIATGRGKDPGLHKLRNLIEPFTEKYTDLEIKQALHGIGVSIPTTSRLDAALAQIRTNARNQQQPRQDGLPARYERRGAVTYSDRQDAGRESAQARKFRECLEIADELDRQFAQNGGRS